MPLKHPTTELNSFDHVVLYALTPACLQGSNAASLYEVRNTVEALWHQHNLIFTRSKLEIPSWVYFHTRINRMVDKEFIDKTGKKAYRLNRENYHTILDYITLYIKTNYHLKNV